VAARAFNPVDKFLIAYDGGPSVTKALDYVVSSPLLRNAECHLIQAGEADDQANWYMEEAAGKLRGAGFVVHSEITPGDPETIIAEAIRTREIQMLVMGAYGHSPVRAFILGSTTTTMVRTCHVPVLMFR